MTAPLRLIRSELAKIYREECTVSETVARRLLRTSATASTTAARRALRPRAATASFGAGANPTGAPQGVIGFFEVIEIFFAYPLPCNFRY